MKLHLAAQLASTYQGHMVKSGSQQVMPLEIVVEHLTHLLIKVSFKIKGETFLFRAMLSEQKEGILMLIQNRVTSNYILSGQSGFLHKKPNVHGGWLPKIESFYFHVALNYFAEYSTEVYFIGKRSSTGEKKDVISGFSLIPDSLGCYPS